ncbi:ASCH domain-containing protein [Algoriphagus namhaensis]
MLFNQKHLTGIKDGNVTLAFRKWKKPSVKQGSIIKTAVGQIEIVGMKTVEVQEITNQDARNAGFPSLDELLALLETIENGTIYRIKVAYHSPDPRIALRNQTDITDEKFAAIRAKLERLDKYSKEGNWTHSVLMAIQKNPNLRAADLAQLLSKEKEWLKLKVRKLKNLGLTISHHPGYEISPLGKAYLKKYN